MTACLDELLSEELSYVANADDCNDSDASTYPGSSREGGELCVRDSDGDGYGDSTASQPYDAGTDCNDADESIFPNTAQYEDDDLCVVDSDGDGYGDAIPSVNADAVMTVTTAIHWFIPATTTPRQPCILDSDAMALDRAIPLSPMTQAQTATTAMPKSIPINESSAI